MGRVKKEKKYYFSDREEQAVVDYNNTSSKDEKDRIYNSILREPFRIMTESILRRYTTNHIGNYDIHEVEANALSHLIENMIKYNPNMILKSGSKAKAYSYCQTIIRNYYRDHSKKSYNEKKNNLLFDDYVDDIYNRPEYIYEIEDENISEIELLISNVIESISNVLENDSNLKENEINVGYAIINILDNWNILFMEETPNGKYEKKITNKYEKNKILLYLKEQTNLDTKEIRQSMKAFKSLYYIEKMAIINNR